MLTRCATLVTTATLLTAGTTIPYSPQKDAQIGALLAIKVRERAKPLSSRATQDYINRLGQRLAAMWPNTGWSFSFEVVESAVGGPAHEPLGLPGGIVFVPAGLIAAAEEEGELAGMLAHAMAHSIASRNASPVSLDALNWQELLSSRPNRTLELGADRMAVAAAANAGFEPQALIRYYLRELPDDSGAKYPSALPRADRIAALREAVAKLPHATYSASSEFLEVRSEIRKTFSDAKPPEPGPSLRRGK